MQQAALLAEVINTNSAHQRVITSITEDYLLLTALVCNRLGSNMCFFQTFIIAFQIRYKSERHVFNNDDINNQKVELKYQVGLGYV